MLQGNDPIPLPPVEFPLSIVPTESALYEMLTNRYCPFPSSPSSSPPALSALSLSPTSLSPPSLSPTSLSPLGDKEVGDKEGGKGGDKAEKGCVVNVPFPQQDLLAIKRLLTTGEAKKLTLSFVNAVNYLGIPFGKYLQYKYEDDLFRTRLYDPAFVNSEIQDRNYHLRPLTETMVETFELASNLHWVYATYIFNTWEDVSVYTPRDVPLPSSERDRQGQEPPRQILLFHTYPRPYINIETINHDDVIQQIRNVTNGFVQRDRQYEGRLIRESIRSRRSINERSVIRDNFPNDYLSFTAFLENYQSRFANRPVSSYTIPFDYKLTLANIRERLTIHPVVASIFGSPAIPESANLLLAGGYVVNSIIHYETNADLDFFVYGVRDTEATNLITNVINHLGKTSYLEIREVSRTKHAVTVMVSDTRDRTRPFPYMVYKVQFILRLYRTPSEILHGFDVDCCGCGYDGKEIWLTQRAENAIREMVNVVDFDRASPSYEARLAKYMGRGFSVFVPGLDKSKIRISPIKNPSTLQGLSKLIYYHYSQWRDYNIRENNQVADPSDYEVNHAYGDIRRKLKQMGIGFWDARMGSVPIPPEVRRYLPLLYNLHSFDDFSNYYRKNEDPRDEMDPTPRIGSYGFYRGSNPSVIVEMKYSPSRMPNGQWLTSNWHIIPPEIREDFRSQKGLSLDLPPSITWKVTNPGEQATGTFHRVMMQSGDFQAWYQGPLYLQSNPTGRAPSPPAARPRRAPSPSVADKVWGENNQFL